MISEITYTEDEKSQINAFNKLPQESKIGYWENTHNGPLTKLKERIKNHYLHAQDYTCPYCRQRIVVEHNGAWDAEHVIPKDKYPEFMFEAKNLCIACKDCNGEKWNDDVLRNKGRTTFPTKDTDYLISHPHFDNYENNIKVIVLGLFYLPKNDKGRKTVEVCGLLRFLYQLAGYKSGSKDVDKLMQELTSELISSNDGQQRLYLLFLIEKVAKDGAEKIMDQNITARLSSSVR
jgi:5-methylcytosine-specific restriction endonuclease McrA